MAKKIGHGLIIAVLILFAVIIFLPLIWMVLTGFKTNKELFLEPWKLPEVWQFKNYLTRGTQASGHFLKTV